MVRVVIDLLTEGAKQGKIIALKRDRKLDTNHISINLSSQRSILGQNLLCNMKLPKTVGY